MVAYQATIGSVLLTVAWQLLSEHSVPISDHLGAEDHTHTALKGQQACRSPDL